MTMLDRMRRHRNWLKWSLALVCLAFVIFYIPDFLSDPTTDLAATDTVAVVEGREISGAEFRRTYQSQIQAYRAAYGGNMSEQLLRQLGVEQQILQQMIDERAALAEAERLGIEVSDAEVRQRILLIPSFQENGAFIGEDRYQQLLRSQRPPIMPADFEESIRRALVVEKLRTAITEWLSIPDREIEQEYRRRNDKVKLALVSFPADSFRPDVEASDAEVASHFEANKEDFRIPEKRKIRYVLVDVEALRAKTVVPPAEIERRYNENFEQYSTPAEIRASHILLRTEGKDEAAVRAQAEEILKQARAGTDFAELAKKHSEDEGTRDSGGDLDFFGRGRMVPEFDEVAFAMEAGQVSDLVRTPYGFHIIKVVEKKGGTTQSLDEVRPPLTEQLTFELAQTQAADIAERLDARIDDPSDLDAAAKEQNLTVQESEFFARDEPISGIGAAPQLASEVFTLSEGQVTGAVATARGFVIAAVGPRQDPYLPELDAVKERVREAVLQKKALEMAQQKANEVAGQLKGASDFEAAAKRAGFEAETTDLLTRDSPVPGLGVSPEVTARAFALDANTVSDPIVTDRGAAVIKVLEKQETTADDLTANKDQFREELLADRRGRFFSSYMVKAKGKMDIQVNRQALQRIVG